MLLLSHSGEIPAQRASGSGVLNSGEKVEDVYGGGNSHTGVVEDGNNDDYFVNGKDCPVGHWLILESW